MDSYAVEVEGSGDCGTGERSEEIVDSNHEGGIQRRRLPQTNRVF